MIILILTSTWLICAMRNPNFWYQELVDAFSARGLQGPFYFQWGADLKVQYGTAITLLVLNVIGAAVIIVRDTLRDSPKPLNYISYFFYVFFLFASLLDAILLISLFVMLIFTVIVQVQIWNLVVQVFLTLLVYARVYFQELWSDRIALKSLLLKLFKLESQFNGESSVSTITAESLDNAFEKLKNDYNCGQASGSNSGIKLTADENSLKLQLNGTLIFLNKFDVPSITQNFYDHCLNLEFQGHKRCLWLRVLRFGKLCVWPPMMVSLVFISIMAYGDLYHISPSNRFFASFVAIIVPLVVQHFNPGGSSGKSINKYNRKLQRELREAINKYEEHLVVHDFTESVIRPATTEEKEDHLNSFCKVYTFRPEKSSNLVSVSAHAAKTSGAPLTSIPPRHPSEGSVPHEERQVPATEENEC
ncbi:unnamed protein product [Lymnaea stagnalis]|uniref:Uncharacterized protein n=1 Tax=Lymnaea stagnalis TaxID=6523 RepID=A0AAV2H2K1_LYMST